MATQTLEIQRSSASMWGGKTGIRTLPTVAKYIDTSTCIGCAVSLRSFGRSDSDRSSWSTADCGRPTCCKVLSVESG